MKNDAIGKTGFDINNYYSDLIDSVNDLIFILDLNGNFQYFNKRAIEISGYTIEEMIGRSFVSILSEADIEKAMNNFKKGLSGETISIYDIDILLKNGRMLPVEINMNNLCEKNGNIIGRVGIARDITDRKKAEKLREALQSISTSIHSVDSLDEFYAIIHESLGKIIDCRNFFIALYDKKSDSIEFPYFIDERDELFKIKDASSSDSLTAKVILEGNSAFFSESDLYNIYVIGKKAPWGSISKVWLGAPLKIDKDVIGAVGLQSYDNPDAYSRNDINLLETVSDQIAIAIERKFAQNALKKSEVKYRQIFNLSPEIIALVNTDNILLDINNSVYSWLGYKPDEVINLSIPELPFISEKSKKIITENSQKRRTGEAVAPYLVEFISKRGELFYGQLFAAIITDDNGDPLFTLSAISDITERIKAEREILKFKTLADSANYGVAICSLRGDIEYINEYFAEIHNMNQAELAGSHFIDLLDDSKIGSFSDFFRSLFSTESLMAYEMWHKKKNGESFPMLLNGKIIPNEFGEPQFVAISATDISRRIAYENKQKELIKELNLSKEELQLSANEMSELNEKLRESEEKLINLNASKDKFFSIISHDLKSPFQGFLGLTKILANDVDKLSLVETKELSESLSNSAEQVYKLLENLLSWSRIQRDGVEYNPDNINICEMIDYNSVLYKANAEKKKIKFRNNIPVNLYAYADKDMIDTVIRNLMSNAVKFTNYGGTIKFNGGYNNEMCWLTIEDDGVGIESSTIKKLFMLGTHITTAGTANEKGTGLGLILCKDLVEKCYGHISVDSIVDKGTIFTITLPAESS